MKKILLGTLLLMCSSVFAQTTKTKQAIDSLGKEKQLGGVTVSSRKPLVEVKADKTILNVEASINATGSNAMELLQKAPGVTVDKDDNISLKGKNGVQVFIDGRPSQLSGSDLAALLKGMNSSDIEAIEMISNPSAKYEASGNAGIINIRLKKDKRFGLNGNVSVGAGYGKSLKSNNSFALNYRNKIANWFGNYSNSFGNNQMYIDLYRIQVDSIFDQHTILNRNQNVHNFKVGADFFINKKSTVGFIVTGNLADGTNNSNSYTKISPDSTMKLVKTLFALNNVNDSHHNMNFNTNYRYSDSVGRELDIDANYGFYKNRGTSYQPNTYVFANNDSTVQYLYKSNTPTDINIYTAKVDYEFPIKKGKLGVGGKFSSVKTDNTYDFWNVISNVDVVDSNRSNKFSYTENVNALYANYNTPVGKKVKIQAGLRVENTNSTGKLTTNNIANNSTVDRSYTDLFPSASITYAKVPTSQFTASYSRRIDRPSYQDLNPFQQKIDELSYRQGNAYLKPQYTNSVELNYLYKFFLSTTLGYSHVSDVFAQYIDTTEGNKSFIMSRNLATQDIVNLTIGSPLRFGKIYSGYANINSSYSMYKADFGGGKKIDVSVFNFHYYMQNSFAITKKTTAELSGWFAGPGIWGGTFKSKSMGGFDVGLQRKMLNDNGTLKLSFTDVLNTMHWRASSLSTSNSINGMGGWESQQVKLNFSYRFGNKKMKESGQHSNSADEESKRAEKKDGMGL